YMNKLKAVQKTFLTSQQLEAANAVQSEIEQVEGRVKLFLKGGDLVVPGLLPTDESSEDQNKESPTIIRSEEAKALHGEFLDRLRRGVTAINELYYTKSTEAQKVKMAESDLTSANTLEALKSELKAELDAIAGKPRLPGAEMSAKPGKGDDLLSEQFRKRWIEESGKWDFIDGSLVGSGKSEIKYKSKIRAPFVLTFDFRVKKGMRPRIYVGGKDLRIANEGYKNQIGLYPLAGKEEPVPYEIGKKYSVKFVANRRYLELYLDDQLVTKRDSGLDEEIEFIGFFGGDGFSPGTTEFSNIRLE
ncbi:MAG: hypothetical protein KBF76_20590, partial [Verrucomicrobiales bacterium]|nr:hypothetical protein [Verrucomicrobiales bacterium]